MIQQAKWVDLTFSFNMPAGKFMAILERFWGTPPRIDEFVKGMPQDLLTRTENGKWSIQQHIGHLLDLEELVEKRLNDYEAGASVLTAADMTNEKTENARHNEKKISEVTGAFRLARMELVERLVRYDEEMIVKTAIHPRLNMPMRLMDLITFSAEHDDHHMAAMRLLKRKFLEIG